jgi:hypothetical protein
LVFSCHSPISESESASEKSTVVRTAPESTLLFLKNYNGKYPYDCQLLDNPVTGPRLRKILGQRYDFVKSIWNVETPIEIKDSLFYAWAMQENSGGDPSAVVMADINKDCLFVGIRDQGKVSLYSESDALYPERLVAWSKEKIQ